MYGSCKPLPSGRGAGIFPLMPPRFLLPASARATATALVLTVSLASGLTGVGAWAGWRMAEQHRRGAEAAIRRQLDLVADGLANSAQVQGWFTLRTLLKVSHASALAGPLPPVAALSARAAAEAIGPGMVPLDPVRFFIVDPRNHRWQANGPPLTAVQRAGRDSLLDARLGTGPGATGADSSGNIELGDTSAALASRFRYWIADTGASAVFVVAAPLNRGGLLHGFEVPLSQIRERLFAEVARAHQPAGGGRGTPLSVRISGPSGDELFATTPPPSGELRGSARMTGSLAAAVEVSLQPEAAGLLVDGGLPTRPGAWIGSTFAVVALLLAGTGLAAWRAFELGRMRADFASSISHELRTPLTQIQLFAETLLLDRARTAEARRGALEAIVRETRRLVHLLENVLAVSRAGRPSERLLLREERVDRLIDEVMTSFGPLLRQRGITPVVEVGGPLLFPVDAEALRRILVNLVDNAIRHAPGGQSIHVRAGSDAGHLQLSVEDEGAGMPDGDLARLWQPFERGAATGGTGLGLAVVRRLVDLHGGAVRVDRGTAGGARFIVTFPRPAATGAGA